MADITVDKLSVELDMEAQNTNGIENLTKTLTNLGNVVSPTIRKIGNLKKSVSGIREISNSLNSINMNFFSNNLTKMVNSLSVLNNVGKTNLDSFSKQINNMIKSSAALDKMNLEKFTTNIGSISKAVKPLTMLDKSKLSGFINQLNKIPDLEKKLDDKTIDKFAVKIKKLSDAMLPLANNMAKITKGFASLPSKVNKVANSMERSRKSFSLFGKLKSMTRAVAGIVGGRLVGNFLGGVVDKSNKYVEDLNLFNVAMGESADRAKKWIDTVSELLGLDPSNMMRYMGVFNMMATGFGLTNEKAEIMSKNLTQLTYDIASFYNLKIDEAAQKVQSAFAGKIICLIYKGLYIVTHLIAGNSKRVMA